MVKKKHVPRRYQDEAIKTLSKGLNRVGARGILHGACAIGKTLIALWTVEHLRKAHKLPRDLVLVLVPRLDLLAQTLREWKAQARQPFKHLAVCSDSDWDEGDSRQTAERLGITSTTDPEKIARFMRSKGTKVVFATYQSTPKISEACRMSRTPRFDMAVFDEAHRTAVGGGPGMFRTALYDENIPIDRRLFMTATLRSFTAGAIAKAMLRNEGIASMDDEDLYGPVLWRMTFAEALERGIISDWRVVVMAVTEQEVLEAIQDHTAIDHGGYPVDADIVAKNVAVAKAMRKYQLAKVITFHRRVEEARNFAVPTHPHSFGFALDVSYRIQDLPDELPEGDVLTRHISGKTKMQERVDVLDALRDRDGVVIVSNCNCLTEGIDVPALDAVVFMHEKKSTRDIVQGASRALRVPPGAGKSVGYIVIPMVLGEGVTEENLDEHPAFDTVATVLRELRSHDVSLGDEIDEIQAAEGDGESPGGVQKMKVTGLSTELNTERVAKAILMKIADLSHDPFEVGFLHLQEWVRRYGTLSGVNSKTTTASGYELGKFITGVQVKFRRNNLPGYKAGKLESLYGWSWSLHDMTWWGRYAEMCRYAQDHDIRLGIETGQKFLNSWAVKQRTDYKNGILSPERVKALESIDGWVWSLRNWQWEKQLREFAEGKMDQEKAQEWVTKQRFRYEQRKLHRDRVRQLEAIPGWTWDSGVTRPEMEDFKDWWKEKRANGLYPTNKEISRRRPQRIGDMWHSMMAEELRDFGYRETSSDRSWMGKYSLILRKTKSSRGRKINQLHQTWARLQRERHRSGELEDWKVKLLEEIPGWEWEPKTGVCGTPWEQRFAEVVSIIEDDPDVVDAIDLLSPWTPSPELRGWLRRQALRKPGGKKLSEGNRQKLESLRGFTTDSELLTWRVWCRRADRMHAEKGKVIGGEKKWVQEQIDNRDRLTPIQVTDLVALSWFSWSMFDPPPPEPVEKKPDHQEQARRQWEVDFKRFAEFVRNNGAHRLWRPNSDDGKWAAKFFDRHFHNRKVVDAERSRASILELVGGHARRSDIFWNYVFELLRDSVDNNGWEHLKEIPNITSGLHLGRWVQMQRQEKRRGALPADREAKLVSLPGWQWKAAPGTPEEFEKQWLTKFKILTEYVRLNGLHSLPRGGHLTYKSVRLAQWANNQRVRKANGLLPKHRVKLLEKVPGWTW